MNTMELNMVIHATVVTMLICWSQLNHMSATHLALVTVTERLQLVEVHTA